MKRKTTEEERELFRKHISEAVLKPIVAKPKSRKKMVGQDRSPPQCEAPGEGGAHGALSRVQRAEGVNQLDGNTAEKLRCGRLVPGRRLDLHGRTEEAAHRTLREFLARAQADGLRLVLVVTGIGNPKAHEGAEWARPFRGALKQMTPRWLSEKDFSALISGWAPAHKRHGGEGALYVYLRKKS
jgi:DNA-nicking Smr family endonuclease